MLIGTVKKPKGPSFKKAALTKKSLSGTMLEFKAPKPSRANNPNWTDTPTPESFDIYDENIFSLPYKIDNYQGDLKSVKIFLASWWFKQLGWTTYAGEASFFGRVFTLDVLPAGETFFDKVAFAREIERDIHQSEFSKFIGCHSKDLGSFTRFEQPKYLAPINWQWINRGGVDWLYYEVQPLYGGEEHICWFTPIGHRHFLRFDFSFTKSASNAGNAYRLSQKVSSEPFLELMHNIFDTLQLELSPHALKQRDEFSTTNKQSHYPVVQPTDEQLSQAAEAMYLWSDREYRGNSKNGDHREAPEKIKSFIEGRVRPKLLDGAYSQQANLSVTSKGLR